MVCSCARQDLVRNGLVGVRDKELQHTYLVLFGEVLRFFLVERCMPVSSLDAVVQNLLRSMESRHAKNIRDVAAQVLLMLVASSGDAVETVRSPQVLSELWRLHENGHEVALAILVCALSRGLHVGPAVSLLGRGGMRIDRVLASLSSSHASVQSAMLCLLGMVVDVGALSNEVVAGGEFRAQRAVLSDPAVLGRVFGLGMESSSPFNVGVFCSAVRSSVSIAHVLFIACRVCIVDSGLRMCV
jgi:hypothetical protein